MANRIVLNETSYHGAGAIPPLWDEAAPGDTFAKPLSAPDPDLVKFGVAER